jgi:phosphoribosylformimino-5-aminoimidazole carboxamide ribotide isomerase
MIVIPAIDLREGACVQLVGGEYAKEQVRLDDPVWVARTWAQQGFRRLHVVDLDAATGRGENRALVRDLLSLGELEVQVGGGVRSAERIEELLDAGASRVVLGTRALEEPDWLAEMTSLFPGELIVAADVRDRRIVTRGWARTLPHHVLDTVSELDDLPLAGVMVTAVHKEGRLAGPDLALMEDIVEATHLPVLASGGIAAPGDLRALEHRGVSGAIVGMALYTGALEPRAVAQEFEA